MVLGRHPPVEREPQTTDTDLRPSATLLGRPLDKSTRRLTQNGPRSVGAGREQPRQSLQPRVWDMSSFRHEAPPFTAGHTSEHLSKTEYSNQ